MSCPFCKSLISKVIDKRSVIGRGEIRRRRECLKCGKRFTTYEGLADLRVLVVKRDGRREPYERQKLLGGLEKALEKRPGLDQAEMIADKIEGRLRARGVREIQSAVLGNWVLSELKRLDTVAYLRFASVYRQFKDLKDFTKEIKSL